jgi:putative addiction module killer protein
VKAVGDGVSEMRIPYGPGYRVYYIARGPIVVVLLCGGDKSSQVRDIEKAKAIALQWKE